MPVRTVWRRAVLTLASTAVTASAVLGGTVTAMAVQQAGGRVGLDGGVTQWSRTAPPAWSVARPAGPAQDYGDLIAQVEQQDVAGVQASDTQIRVVAIEDAAGDVRAWRVQLPSTQFWNPLGGAGVNDVGAGVTLALFPGVRTLYERAAMDAMRRAGVEHSTAPVMLTGWSLGGMVAGRLAADTRLSARVTSVVTAGAPIDRYRGAIGPGVSVTQFDNVLDPVHRLEFAGFTASDAHARAGWQTRTFVDTRVHSAAVYADGVRAHGRQVRPQDRKFFATPRRGTHERVFSMAYVRR